MSTSAERILSRQVGTVLLLFKFKLSLQREKKKKR